MLVQILGFHENILRAKNPRRIQRIERTPLPVAKAISRPQGKRSRDGPAIHARCSVGSFREWMGNPSWGREMASSREQRTSGNGVPHAAFPSSVQVPIFFSFNPVSDEGQWQGSGCVKLVKKFEFLLYHISLLIDK